MLQSPVFKPTILVTDAGRGSAIAIIRSLGRRGWRVVAADAEHTVAGMRSRYAAERLIYPSPETSPPQFIKRMREACLRHRVDLIIPVTDAAMLPLAHARSEFEGVCQIAMPSDAALKAVVDKGKTLALAERLGVPIPRTVRVESIDEALDAAPQLGWPVVIKPQVSRLYRPEQAIERLAVSYADNEVALARQLRPLVGRCPVLLQEFCPGEGHGLELLMHEGQPIAAFQHHRLREMPIHGGPSALRESAELDPTLYQHSVALLSQIRWTGLAMVEFKVGPQGPRLMEINGRVWGSLPLAIHAGMDFPARLVELLLLGPGDAEAAPQTNYQLGVRSHNLELELAWIVSVLRGKKRTRFFSMPSRQEGLRALAELFHPAYKYDILSLADPLPGLSDCARILARSAARLFGKKKTASLSAGASNCRPVLATTQSLAPGP